MELDLKDRKILTLLDINSRQPVSEIAKKVRLSKQAVKHRMEKMEREGIIQHYYAVTDIYRLSRISGRLWIKLHGSYDEQEIIDFALNMKDMGWVMTLSGAYDMILIPWSKDLLSLHNTIQKLKFKFGENLKTVDVSFIIRAHHMSHRYLTGEKTLHEMIMEQKYDPYSADEIDEKILSILAENSRTPLTAIANQLNISDRTVKYRIKKLEKNKVILGYMVSTDSAKLGYTWYKVFLSLQNLTPEKYNELISFLKSKTQVTFVTEAIGISDLEFETWLKTNKEFHDLMHEIRIKFNEIIKEFNSVMINKVHKLYYAP